MGKLTYNTYRRIQVGKGEKPVPHTTADVLFMLLRSQIEPNYTLPDMAIDQEMYASLYALSKHHDKSHLLAAALEENGIMPEHQGLVAKLRKQYLLALSRTERIIYELDRIACTFEASEIPFLPLKGSVLREYYPRTWMRTSCDIDILIHPNDLEAAQSALESKLGYPPSSNRTSHDISYYTESGVHLELHFTLIESEVVGKEDKPLEHVWAHATLKEGKQFTYELDSQMFYYYHIAHMVKHFVLGGCGIRPFLDMYIYQTKTGICAQEIAPWLEESGVLTFAREAETLAGVWFGGEPHTSLTRRMEDYLLKAGVYGSMENRVAIQQTQKGGKWAYFWYRVWLPYSVLKHHYPSLDGRPWLLFFYQVRRWWKLLFGGKAKRYVKELKRNQEFDDAKKAETAQFLQELGL